MLYNSTLNRMLIKQDFMENLWQNQFSGVNLGAEIKTPKSMNIKRNIIFTLESRKKDGVLIVENVPIRMRVNFTSKRIEFTTGYRIDAVKWDTNKQRVRNGCTNKLKQSASEINASLFWAILQRCRKSSRSLKQKK